MYTLEGLRKTTRNFVVGCHGKIFLKKILDRYLFLQSKAPKEIHAILTENFSFVSFLVGLRIYQHPYKKSRL